MGPEPASFTAQADGAHVFEVKSLDPKARAGRFTILLEILLSPEENQRHRIVRIDPSPGGGYAGTYELAPGHLVTLSNGDYVGGGRPAGQSQPVEILRPRSDTEFFSGPRPSLEYSAAREYTFRLGAAKEVPGVAIGAFPAVVLAHGYGPATRSLWSGRSPRPPA